MITIMPLMFLPPAVGIMEAWDLVSVAWLPYVVVTIVSTVVVMAVAGRVAQRIIRRKAVKGLRDLKNDRTVK